MMNERRQQEAALLAATTHLAEWNKRLREIDPYLQLVKARENTTLPGLKPAYYHVIRHNPGAPPSILVVEGPNGEFREPDSGLLEQLRRDDLWSDRSIAERERRERERERAEQHAKEHERSERVDEIHDRLKAKASPGVRVPKKIAA